MSEWAETVAYLAIALCAAWALARWGDWRDWGESDERRKEEERWDWRHGR